MIQIERNAYDKILSALQTKNDHMIAEAIGLLDQARKSQSVACEIDGGAVPKCPQCGCNDDLRIIADRLTTCWIDHEWSVMDSDDGDIEWNGQNEAQCGACEWFGKVRDLCGEVKDSPPACPRCTDGPMVKTHHPATAGIPECWTWSCETCGHETQPE